MTESSRTLSRKTILLFSVIIAEGYVVLATELLAIRQSIPYVGNATDTVSVIIAAILLPLAAGYYYGGRFRPARGSKYYMTVRRRLTLNIVIASFFLLPGLSYIPVALFYVSLFRLGVTSHLALVSLYALTFLMCPVYLLGQTVPLISNYFSRQKLSEITGRMLFCSTTGSFLGAIISTLVLMNFAGVHNAVNVVLAILGILVFALCRRKAVDRVAIMAGLVIICFSINSSSRLAKLHIVSDDAYNTIAVETNANGRKMVLNESMSSMLGKDGTKNAYVAFAEKHYLQPLLATTDTPPKNILVIGAAGFTFGLDDTKNHYVYVDIDPAVRRVAEDDFLQRKLSPNKTFAAEDIRAYLARLPEKFDLILIDAFVGRMSLPESLVTREFFTQVKGALNQNGIVLANVITSPNFAGPFSRNFDTTFRSVFPLVTRQIIQPDFNGWERNERKYVNVMYVYHEDSAAPPARIYTDDKNPVSFDRPAQDLLQQKNR